MAGGRDRGRRPVRPAGTREVGTGVFGSGFNFCSVGCRLFCSPKNRSGISLGGLLRNHSGLKSDPKTCHQGQM